jgi:hypothetical protein
VPTAPPERQPLLRYLVPAAALVTAGAAGWWLVARLTVPSIAADEARPIAEAFLAELRTGKPDRIDAAWSGTTAEFKSNQGQEQFRKYVKGQKRLAEPTEFQGSEMTERNGLRVADCRFQARTGPVRVLLAREADRWKVERVLVE